MSAQAESWKASPQQAPPEQFWADFGKFVLASYNYDAAEDDGPKLDHYWNTLLKWADVLMGRYSNDIANHVVIGYIEQQSSRATNGYGEKFLRDLLSKLELKKINQG